MAVVQSSMPISESYYENVVKSSSLNTGTSVSETDKQDSSLNTSSYTYVYDVLPSKYKSHTPNPDYGLVGVENSTQSSSLNKNSKILSQKSIQEIHYWYNYAANLLIQEGKVPKHKIVSKLHEDFNQFYGISWIYEILKEQGTELPREENSINGNNFSSLNMKENKADHINPDYDLSNIRQENSSTNASDSPPNGQNNSSIYCPSYPPCIQQNTHCYENGINSKNNSSLDIILRVTDEDLCNVAQNNSSIYNQGQEGDLCNVAQNNSSLNIADGIDMKKSQMRQNNSSLNIVIHYSV